jgi:hypothetical protein
MSWGRSILAPKAPDAWTPRNSLIVTHRKIVSRDYIAYHQHDDPQQRTKP